MSLSTLGNLRESQSLGRGQRAGTPRWPSSPHLEWEGLELLGAEPGGARVLVWEGLEPLGAEPGVELESWCRGEDEVPT